MSATLAVASFTPSTIRIVKNESTRPLDTPPNAQISLQSDVYPLEVGIIVLASKYSINALYASEIIRCESAGKPYALNVNTNGSRDYSYWQINDRYWKEEMADLGWDITDPEDNLEAGFYILSTYGIEHWNASRHCWGDILNQ